MSPVTGTDELIVHVDPQTRAELDQLALAVARDPSSLVNEAIDAYLAVHRFHVEEITAGLGQAEAGEFATQAEIEAAYAAFK